MTTVYQVFSACIHFPLCSREYQNREKFNRVNLTQLLANNVDFKTLTWISWKIHSRRLIHDFRLEFADKTWRVNNLIYGINACIKNVGISLSATVNHSNGLRLIKLTTDIWFICWCITILSRKTYFRFSSF